MAKKIFLVILDFIVLYLALLITLLVRYGAKFSDIIWRQHFWPFFIIFLGWIVVFYIFNLYDLSFQKNLDLFSNTFKSIFIGSLLVAIFFYLAPAKITNLKPQLTLLINFFVANFAIYSTRRVFQNFIKIPGMAFNTLIIGLNESSLKIARALASQKFFGYQLVGVYNNQSSNINIIDNKITVFNRESLRQLLKNKKINTVISTINLDSDHDLINILFNSLNQKIKYYNYPSFYEHLFNKIPVTEVSHTWFLENLSENRKTFYEIAKRLIDLVMALVIFTITLPFWPIIMLVIILDNRGPIFFTQIRVGKNNKPFQAIKFRSMHINAENNGPQWAQKNDSRVTRFGKFMRKIRLDEIPQLLNVLKGEMSFVGPRPERPEFVESLQKEIPFYKERLLVKPGLSGWAQIAGPTYGGSREESLEKLQYDLYYIKNRSLFFDLGIILKTINIILKRQGQ